ncbi:hypothetical protein ABZ807_06000 [Micromonospora sp. NPDC047548]|uniref:hypothetical protein n=1 Tax=Micromonospora sp. NPDC047548 TaxID=3155624 RepID=UPI0033F3866B
MAKKMLGKIVAGAALGGATLLLFSPGSAYASGQAEYVGKVVDKPQVNLLDFCQDDKGWNGRDWDRKDHDRKDEDRKDHDRKDHEDRKDEDRKDHDRKDEDRKDHDRKDHEDRKDEDRKDEDRKDHDRKDEDRKDWGGSNWDSGNEVWQSGQGGGMAADSDMRDDRKDEDRKDENRKDEDRKDHDRKDHEGKDEDRKDHDRKDHEGKDEDRRDHCMPRGHVDGGDGGMTTTSTNRGLATGGAGMIGAATLGGIVLMRRRRANDLV